MSHTLATVAQFKAHLTDNPSGITANIDDSALVTLEGASRTVEAFTDRSDFGTGFGPRIASNEYRGDGTSELWLRDDLLVVASITVYDPVNAGTASYTLGTADYTLSPLSGPPYRVVELHGYGQLGAFPSGSRLVVAGTASSAPIELLTTSVTFTAAGSTDTSLTVSAGSVISAGHTIRYGTEDIYVRAVSSGTVLSVLRGQNGSTAGTVASGGTAVVYVYPEAAVSACLAVAQRRRKSQDAGLTGDFGVQQTTSFRDTERSALRAHVGHLKVYGAG